MCTNYFSYKYFMKALFLNGIFILILQEDYSLRKKKKKNPRKQFLGEREIVHGEKKKRLSLFPEFLFCNYQYSLCLPILTSQSISEYIKQGSTTAGWVTGGGSRLPCEPGSSDCRHKPLQSAACDASGKGHQGWPIATYVHG